ncbi:hypothetical protein SM124_09995 [Bacillus sp. 31A1R]|uniref:Uncharacterized protein n=1 Tax=Robertmurraya mangrovi TaxID=3098077 RepID=A0ABU5IY29_9BACI|nr:hypothetical protein [Bacillus sp. 31A1R]MDZ5472078.1 hypothetical protein [Bacillus sp. 31A1R]
MKKIIMGLSMILVLLSTLLSFPENSEASMSSEARSKFSRALEKDLRNNAHYYHLNSAVILDSFDMEGNVFKMIKTDDADTPENEEITEEYTSHLAVALVEYKQKRDSFFYFTKKEIYYYDVEKEEFLTSSNVFMNDKISAFFKHHLDDLKKEMTPLSNLIIMAMISLLLIVPYLIMIFHNQGSQTNANVYNNQRNVRG